MLSSILTGLVYASLFSLADLRSLSSTDEDPYAGLEEVDAQTRRAINQKLGDRSGPRWSLPTMPHRASLATTSRRLKFRPSVSHSCLYIVALYLSSTFDYFFW